MVSTRTNAFDNIGIQDTRGKSEITVAPEDGRPGDWICPNDNCKHHNYKFRQICQKCFTNKYGENVVVQEGKKPGDWNCPIDGNLNYAWRTHCQKCGNQGPRGAGNPMMAQTNYRNPNDWTCPNCGFHCYASRTACIKCGCTKPPLGRGMGMGQQYGYPQHGMGQHGFGQQSRFGYFGNIQKGLKAGDWNCPNCFDLVYEWRSHCRKCNTPKPPGGTGFGGSGFGGSGFGGTGFRGTGFGGPGVMVPNYYVPRSTGRPGDWTCPKCGDHVYASRSCCRKCGTPKPANGHLAVDTLPELFGGDWRCPKCFDHVYASRAVCRKCNTPKPVVP